MDFMDFMGFIGLAFFIGVLFGFALFELIRVGHNSVVRRFYEKRIIQMNNQYDELFSQIDEQNQYKVKYEALTAELNDMAKKFPLFNPFNRVDEAKQQGVKFEKDELRKLVGFKIKDEEGGV